MLKLNKYLRELGIDENFYLFDEKMKQLDYRYKEDENGFVPAECWNLDTTFAMYIYSHLCYFRDNCNYGHPGNLSEEQWGNILNKMIESSQGKILNAAFLLIFALCILFLSAKKKKPFRIFLILTVVSGILGVYFNFRFYDFVFIVSAVVTAVNMLLRKIILI